MVPVFVKGGIDMTEKTIMNTLFKHCHYYTKMSESLTQNGCSNAAAITHIRVATLAELIIDLKLECEYSDWCKQNEEE